MFSGASISLRDLSLEDLMSRPRFSFRLFIIESHFVAAVLDELLAAVQIAIQWPHFSVELSRVGLRETHCRMISMRSA